MPAVGSPPAAGEKEEEEQRMVRSGGQQRRGGGAADTHERPEGSPSRTQKKKQRRAAARGDQGSDLITRGSIAGLGEEAADDVGAVAMEDAEGEVRRLFEGEGRSCL